MSRITVTIDTPDTLDTIDFVFKVDDALNMGFKHEFAMWTVEPKCGKWKRHPSEREYDVCTNCQTGVKRREYGWNDNGSEWVTEASYKFCPYCGARMRRGE